MKKNLYTHGIELANLKIINAPPEEFRAKLEQVKYRGYEVEQLADGRKLLITKPGGKFVFGRAKREDFMVWVYDTRNLTLWLISHKDIYNDLEAKGEANPSDTIKIIDALEMVFIGKEPDDILRTANLVNPVGESPEVLIKAYKWIWGQEDCNYPEGEGREMSMRAIRALRDQLRAG